jgi:hypothetical protein
MSLKEDMVQELLMTAVIVVKELTESPNYVLITTKDYQKDKRQYQDHMVEYFAQDASNQELLEHFC